MDDGRLPYTRIGTKRLIPKRALLDFLQRPRPSYEAESLDAAP